VFSDEIEMLRADAMPLIDPIPELQDHPITPGKIWDVIAHVMQPTTRDELSLLTGEELADVIRAEMDRIVKNGEEADLSDADCLTNVTSGKVRGIPAKSITDLHLDHLQDVHRLLVEEWFAAAMPEVNYHRRKLLQCFKTLSPKPHLKRLGKSLESSETRSTTTSETSDGHLTLGGSPHLLGNLRRRS
jgi:hypothetical protein